MRSGLWKLMWEGEFASVQFRDVFAFSTYCAPGLRLDVGDVNFQVFDKQTFTLLSTGCQSIWSRIYCTLHTANASNPPMAPLD